MLHYIPCTGSGFGAKLQPVPEGGFPVVLFVSGGAWIIGYKLWGFIMGIVFQLADVPAYAMVGAASTLAALFRAPLTASLLLFELTRNYDILIPLLASAGVGSLVSDIVENKIEARKYRTK